MKNKFPVWIIATAVLVAVVGFAAAMGNYIIAVGVSAAVILVVVFWQWPNILSYKGQSEYAKGNNNKALTLLKKAHESSRARSANSNTYAYILLRVGQSDEASKVLNYVLLNPKLKKEEKLQTKQILSLVRYKQGDISDALRLMEEVFEGYKNTSVYGALGYYKILSKSPDMDEFNREAYEYNKDDKVIIDNMVILSMMHGDNEKARELSDKSIDAGNKGVEIYYHAGQAYLALGDANKALELFKKAQSCTRSFMTTVSEKEISEAIAGIEG